MKMKRYFRLKYLGFMVIVLLLGGLSLGENREYKIVYAQADQTQSLKVGEKIPDVVVTSITNKKFSLLNIVSQKPTLLIFYRGGWCPYCNVHLGQIQEAEKKFLNLGIQIMAISPDKVSEMVQTVDKHSLNFPLFSDSTMAAAKAFGLAFQVDTATLELYKKYDINLTRSSGMAHNQLPVPAAFLIDKKGVVQFAYANAEYKTRIDIKNLLAEALKIKDN